ncbi:hypothetical protein J3458_002808 [Metarhizium acridum]|uniref:uncharacterized protein n=1 Tax=Metarhizium acridum TaxID=92637 RepID=UPI001C6B2787|nr:hypothetical protein J3458_002808 [Metarhizium acridum]
MKASFIASLVGATVVAAECPPVGSTDDQGRYSCNPAHQYPNGQVCAVIDGCFYLSKPVDNSPAEPSETAAACPASGSTDDQGRYSCNPAHQYPNGQTCVAINGCYFLCGADGKPVDNKPSGSAQPPQPTAACPAPGSTDSQGRYSCNPAHQYPNGQTCVAIDGCYFLCGADGKPVDNKPSGSAQPPQPTAACPAPGSTDSQGRYSCNPAHQYPNGQTCVAIDGCYFLCGADGKPVDNKPSGSAQPPQPTAACPASGSTDSQGRYSCNPAHQYPNGQTCTVIDGCYYLTSGGKPVNNNNGTTTTQPPVVAGASSLQAAGALVLAAFVLLL